MRWSMNPKINELGFPDSVTGGNMKSDRAYMRMKKSDLVDQIKCAQVNYEALTVTAIRIGHVVDALAKIIDENNIKVDWMKLSMDEQNAQ